MFAEISTVKDTHKKWILTFTACAVLAVLLFSVISEICLKRINESIIGRKAVDLSLQEECLLGSAISEDLFYYKVNMFSALKPDIAALGSSRTTQFRREFFQDASFYTMGGTCPCIDDAAFTYEQMSKVHTPEILIFGIDLWWLNPENDTKPREKYLWGKSLPEQKLHVYLSLWEKLYQNAEIRSQLLHPDYQIFDTYEGRRTIGLQAGVRQAGYRPDGSYQNGTNFKENSTTAERFADAYHRMETGTNRFQWADHLAPEECEKLQDLIRKMKMGGSRLIVFLPPFPHEIYEYMRNSEHYRNYLEEFEEFTEELCRTEGVTFYDFSDMAWFGSSDDEALDGFHGSDKAYGRILLFMKNNEILGDYINEDSILNFIGENAAAEQ